jgi:hypothetical protein
MHGMPMSATLINHTGTMDDLNRTAVFHAHIFPLFDGRIAFDAGKPVVDVTDLLNVCVCVVFDGQCEEINYLKVTEVTAEIFHNADYSVNIMINVVHSREPKHCLYHRRLAASPLGIPCDG